MEDGKKVIIEKNAESGIKSKADIRRKFLKGTPVFLLLANRPAFAASCSISGFMSAKVGTSLTNYDGGLCDGWSPGNWKNDQGQITLDAWAEAGVSPSTAFSTIFSTNNMNMSFGDGIRKVVNGVPEPSLMNYTSGISYSMMQVIMGILSGANGVKDITMHAAATYLNASFLTNGGGGTAPDPWMINYISPTDVVGMYLLYELVYLADPAPAPSVTYHYERGGAVIAESQNMSVAEFKSFFVSLSNGSGSETWQDGY